MIMNPSVALTYSDFAFSGRRRNLSASRTLLSLSNTESSASEISSMRKTAPFFILSTSGPSYHSNSFSFATMCFSSYVESSYTFSGAIEGTYSSIFTLRSIETVASNIAAICSGERSIVFRNSSRLAIFCSLLRTGLRDPRKSLDSVY